MPIKASTLAELRTTAVINSREIVAAIDAYMRDPAADACWFSSGHGLDIAFTVHATPTLRGTERAGSRKKTFGNALAVAIMGAHPTEP